MPKIVIASRKSDLARIQAQSVAAALQRAHPNLETELCYRESLGDKNQHDPLWKMPEKGVFTQDFREDLLAEQIDIVVHSWKDLPTEMPDDTVVVGALPRADQRDLLLIKKSLLDRGSQSILKILSSSPRRSHNLTGALMQLLPSTLGVRSVLFGDIRGNVPTRVQKCLDDDSAHGLVLAKAGIDRLLSASGDEFAPMRLRLQKMLSEFRWAVLPLSLNPTAAAQGALALEIKSTRDDLRTWLAPLICPMTTAQVRVERAILKSYGGGCHQKIGVSVLAHSLGALLSIQGLTDDGQNLASFGVLVDDLRRARPELFANLADDLAMLGQAPTVSLAWSSESNLDARQVKAAQAASYFPKSKDNATKIFDRRVLDVDLEPLRPKPLVVSRANALPDTYQPGAEQILWSAGLDTWRALATRGYWVSGTFDSLGERAQSPSLSASIESLASEQVAQFVKVTHDASEIDDALAVATYTLVPRDDASIPTPAAQWFYWMSGSAFLWAIARYPEIKNSLHSCGPGHTLQTILSQVSVNNVRVYASYQSWLDQIARINQGSSLR